MVDITPQEEEPQEETTREEMPLQLITRLQKRYTRQ